MIEKTIGSYQLTICHDDNFKQGSSDNVNNYDCEYLFESEYQFGTVLGVKIYCENQYCENQLIRSALIGAEGGRTGLHDNSMIFEHDRILICCSNSVFCLSIPDLVLLWRTEADTVTCFGIFKYQDSYIIHGELEISRLDYNGKIIWSQVGKDIFLTLEGENDFELTNDFILTTDYEYRKYKFDYNGKNFTDMSQF